MRNHTLLLFVCVLLTGGLVVAVAPGCIPHAEERAQNATVATGYQIALEKCVDKAVASLADAGNREAAGDIYVACADKADAVYGKKK